MKVLLLTPEYPPIGGGAANACFYLARELRDQGVELDVLTSSMTKDVEQEFGPSGAVIKLPVRKKAIHYWTYSEMMRYLWATYRFVRRSSQERKYTLIHSFFTIPTGLVAFLQRKQLPYLVSIRGSDVPGYNRRFTAAYPLLRPVIRKLWREAAFVVSNSQGLRDLAWKTMPELDICVIPNGVDTQEFSPSKDKAQVSGGRV